MFIHYGGSRIFRYDYFNCLRWVQLLSLFLFVVMMLNVAEQKQSWFIGRKSTHIPTGLIVSVLIFLELLVVVGGWKYKDDLMSSSTLVISNVSNTHQLGLVMYTDYILYFPNSRNYSSTIYDRCYLINIFEKDLELKNKVI